MASDRPSEQELVKSHRWFAVECNNRAWDLIAQGPEEFADQERLRLLAYASTYHWDQVGTDVNRRRAAALLGFTHARLGEGEPALRYSQSALDSVLGDEGSPSWEVAIAHAGVSYAAEVAGDTQMHAIQYELARQAGEMIDDEADLEPFLGTFGIVPKPGE